MNNFRNLSIVVIVLAAGVGFTLGSKSFHAPAIIAEPSSQSADSDDTSRIQSREDNDSIAWSHGRDGSDANADEHWRKHDSEFSEDPTAHEYEDHATNFLHNPPPDAEIKHRANGDTLIYDPGSNTFAVEDRNGEPRTMFKPDRGDAYWDKQH